MVWPAEVVELCDFAHLSLQSLVEDFELSSDQVLHQRFRRNQHKFKCLFIFVEGEALTNLAGPVLVALYFAMLFGLGEVYYQTSVFFENHTPKVLFSLGQRTLSRDKGLVVQLGG